MKIESRRCDQCQDETPDEATIDWLRVDGLIGLLARLDPGPRCPDVTLDFCSEPCLLQFLKGLVDGLAKPATDSTPKILTYNEGHFILQTSDGPQVRIQIGEAFYTLRLDPERPTDPQLGP